MSVWFQFPHYGLREDQAVRPCSPVLLYALSDVLRLAIVSANDAVNPVVPGFGRQLPDFLLSPTSPSCPSHVLTSFFGFRLLAYALTQNSSPFAKHGR